MQLHSIEGNSQRLDGGAMFGNCPRAVWSRWAPPDEENRIKLACRGLLIRDGHFLMLAETGIGAYMDPQTRMRYGVEQAEHVLLDSLEQLHVHPDDITHVVISHMHFDHAGGLLSAWEKDTVPSLLFKNAEYLVGEKAWERAERPHSRDRASFIPGLCDLLRQSGRLRVVRTADDHPFGPSYRFRFTDGHTPGCTHLEILEPRHMVFASDLIPGTPWVHLPITMGYDRYPERLIEEKKALLEELEADNGALFYTHDPRFALSRVALDAKGKYVPVDPLPVLDWEI